MNETKLKYKRYLIGGALLAATLLGAGLFFIKPDLASHIAGPISTICLALVGIAGVHTGAETYDDHSRRVNGGGG
jgi:hypothetical protein